MKKYIATLFFVIFAFSASAAGAFTPVPLNPDFIRWRESVRNEARGANTLDAGLPSPLSGGVAPVPKDTSYLKDADF